MAAPSTPANLTVGAISSDQIYIAWDNVAAETGFRLYKSEDDITFLLEATLAADVLFYYDQPLEPSTTYYYKISAYNVDGESALSASANDTTLAADTKFIYIHNTGPFDYDANSNYARSSLTRYAIYTDGSISIGDNVSIGGDLSVLTGTVYHGTGDANFGGVVSGAFRIKKVGTELVVQRYDGATWITVAIFSGGGYTPNTTLIDNTDSPYSPVNTEYVIFADTDGGAITINLPVGTDAKNFKIINTGSSGNDITIDPNGTEQLFGGGAGVAFTLYDGESINIHYNATEGWW